MLLDKFHLKFHFQPSIAYQYLLINLILLLFFFKQACHANPGAVKKLAGSSPYILLHLYLKFQTHLQAIMYHFENTSPETNQDFLFQILLIPF